MQSDRHVQHQLTRSQFVKLAACAIAASGLAPAKTLSFGIGTAFADEPTGTASPSAVVDRMRIILATDLHYLAPELIAAGKLADVGVISSGTMITQYTDEIADAMVDYVISANPDVFVMPGDLTYNGERESHEAFVTKLAAIADAGVPVLVIPGNHDIHQAAIKLKGAEPRDHFDAADWFDLYRGFGIDAPGVIDVDESSFSYVWQANPALRLLFVDCNAVEEMWTVPDSTIDWVETQLAAARADGAHVIAFSHQNLLGSGGYNGLAIANGDKLEALYERYGVIGNFSGHMHGQSVLARQTGLFDVITSALSIWPLRFATIDVLTRAGAQQAPRMAETAVPVDVGSGMTAREVSPSSYMIMVDRALETADVNAQDAGELFGTSEYAAQPFSADAEAVDAQVAEDAPDPYPAGADPYAGGRIDYATISLDVASWAQAMGSTNPDLLDFDDFGRQFIYDAQYSTMLMLLEGLESSDENADELADYFARVSVAYADGSQMEIEPRPDLLERFMEAAGDTTATRFAYAFDPTRLRTADAFEATLG